MNVILTNWKILPSPSEKTYLYLSLIFLVFVKFEMMWVQTPPQEHDFFSSFKLIIPRVENTGKFTTDNSLFLNRVGALDSCSTVLW